MPLHELIILPDLASQEPVKTDSLSLAGDGRWVSLVSPRSGLNENSPAL